MNEALLAQDKSISQEGVDENMKLRFLQASKFNVDDAVRDLMATQKWTFDNGANCISLVDC